MSRALAACEGALLVVDASQGMEAQTIANTLLAMEYDLDLIPVLNKVDLPRRSRSGWRVRSSRSSGSDGMRCCSCPPRRALGCTEILDAVVERVPPDGGK